MSLLWVRRVIGHVLFYKPVKKPWKEAVGSNGLSSIFDRDLFEAIEGSEDSFGPSCRSTQLDEQAFPSVSWTKGRLFGEGQG